MLYKTREFANTRLLKLIYHAIFGGHLNYANAVCGQNKNSLILITEESPQNH